MTEHRRIHNGEDNLDTCTACAWASWDTSPRFADHVKTYDCGHDAAVLGCGGCDPGAIELVLTDEGVLRPFDYERDMRNA